MKETEEKDEYVDLAKELKKTMEHEGDNYTNRDWCFSYCHKRLLKGQGDLEVGGQLETIK